VKAWCLRVNCDWATRKNQVHLVCRDVDQARWVGALNPRSSWLVRDKRSQAEVSEIRALKLMYQ